MPSAASIVARAAVLSATLACLAVSATPAGAQQRSTGSITHIEDARDKQGAREPDASAAPTSCAAAYHASLKRIEAGEFAKVETARKLTVEGDPRLPGMFLVPPQPAQRSRPEMAALAAANTLAKSKGRPGGSSDPDSRWIANRLRVDLADYLGQKPSPFLCGGVPQYVETLRGFAERIGTSPERRRDLVATQLAAAQGSIARALAAMKPAAAPRFAPADRPMPDEMMTGGIEGLRPAAGLSRADTTKEPAVGPSAPDPDLPPLKPIPPIAISTVPELSGAVDMLLATAKTAGFVTEPANQMAIGAHGGLSPLGFPVLSRVANAREYVLGPRPLIADRDTRLALARALSDIEALDYLKRTESQPGDPMGSAIFGTLDAILAAHQKDCTCKG